VRFKENNFSDVTSRLYKKSFKMLVVHAIYVTDNSIMSYVKGNWAKFHIWVIRFEQYSNLAGKQILDCPTFVRLTYGGGKTNILTGSNFTLFNDAVSTAGVMWRRIRREDNEW
jgi:hypothetical protein